MSPVEKKRTILLINDVELFLELGKTFFHREDFDLLMAVNAQEVMQLVSERKPDLVFLDMQISGTSGASICRWIKKDPELQKIPVIMLLESGDSESERLCLQAGCDVLLSTPLKRVQMLAAARKILNLEERRQERVVSRVLVHLGTDPQRLSSHFTVNISPGGLFLASDEGFRVGTPLALRIQLPGLSILSGKGRVAWCNDYQGHKKPHLPCGMGIQFLELNAPFQEEIMLFLAQQVA